MTGDLDKRPTIVLDQIVSGYDRLIEKYADDPVYTEYVRFWCKARKAVSALAGARPRTMDVPLMDVGGTWGSAS